MLMTTKDKEAEAMDPLEDGSSLSGYVVLIGIRIEVQETV
jgi:hypothetical protein